MIRLYVSDGVQLFQEEGSGTVTHVWEIQVRCVCGLVKHNHSEPCDKMVCLSHL